MRTLRLVALLSLAGALPACSALFDGSRFTGGTGADDGGHTDAGTDDAGTDDAGTDDGGSEDDAGTDDAGTGDAGTGTCADVTCDAGEYCDDGDCAECDEDGDGFGVDAPGCGGPGALFDCDDGNPAIHPGALPICDNGVDESCGLMAPIGLPADEIGFFPVREVTPPPAAAGGMDLKQVRVAALSADRAALFFQTRPARAMIWYANVALGDTSGAAPPLTAYGDIETLPPATNAVRLSFDVGRDAADGVHLVTMIEDFTARATASPWIRLQDTAISTGGAFGPAGGVSFRPEASGLAAFHVIGQPAVIRSPSGFVLGVPASYTTGSVGSDTLVALGVGTAQLDVLGGSSPPLSSSPPEWAVSSGRAAVFPGAGGSYVAWDGRVDPGAASETSTLSAPGTRLGRPVILDAVEGGARVLRILDPRPTEIVVYRVTCADGMPLASCAFDVTGALHIPIDLSAMDPLMTSFTGDANGFHFAYVAREAGVERVRYVQYDYADAMLVSLPLPTVGNARIVDLDIDGTFVADGGSTGGAGRALLTFAYARRNAASDPTVYVGGVAACVGYGND